MLTPLPPSISLFERDNTQASAQGQTADRKNPFSTDLSSGSSNSIGELLGRGHQRDNFALFNHVLQKAYQRMVFNPDNLASQSTNAEPAGSTTQQIPGYQRSDRISSEQAAGTILDFISHKIKRDKAAGASPEELLATLDAGLKGFEKGFNEAKDIIDDMGLLTPQLSTQIEDTYNRVTEGVDILRDRINGLTNDSSSNDLDNNGLETNDLAPNTIAIPLVNRLLLAGNSSVSQQFSLQLTTQDGDQVSIDISRSAQTRFTAERETSPNSSTFSLNQQSRTSNSFNLSVNGELDADELLAINQLLEDVDQISAEFFAGDLDAAFNLALELDINREELNSLNLELNQTTRVQAIAAYESTSQVDPATPTNNAISPFSELNNLLDNVQKLLSQARTFDEPLKLLENISHQLAGLNSESQSQANPNQAIQGQQQDNPLNQMLQSLINQFEL